MNYGTIMFNSLFISLSQFILIPEKVFKVSFYEKKHSEILHGSFYQRPTKYQKIRYLSLSL